ncbi:site-2 protease family protein [Candidatus Gottesmanbacteria bacterium]|nr:site-2 protease family protein [Candidatus Gottesmanbacteria bacterium]
MLLTALIFFLILTILVFVHELGHFLVARWIGVAVEEFGFGLPPRLWGKKIKDTVYSVNALPIGGFVKLAGEDEDLQDQKRLNLSKQGLTLKKFFWARSKKERAAILIAGVAMNFIVAVGITSYLLTQGVMEPMGRVHIERVVGGSPAQQAGLREKDIITTIDITKITLDMRPSLPIRVPQDLIGFVKVHAGERIVLTVLRDGKPLTVALVPRKDYPKGEGPMGVAISDLERKTYSPAEAPGAAVRINLVRGKEMLLSIGRMLWRLATLQPVGGDVAGPIGIAQVTGEAVKFGWKAVLEFMSILSLNLAVLNILPIPALDGGRLAFVFLEKVLGRKVAPAFERSAHQMGMIVLLFLILLISLNDIMRLTRGG